MTAKTIVDKALLMLSHGNMAGVVDENRESRYYGLAPAYLTLLQYEIASLANLPAVNMQVSSLDKELALDGDTALRLMPAGLAMYFALIDRDDACYNHFSKLYYESLVPSVRPDEVKLEDTYGVSGDPTMR
jgi:hypothetical protein